MEGSTEVKEQEPEKGGVKTVQEIQQCSENDELKFGLLIGLIKVDQVSSKDVLDTVLYLVSVVCLVYLSMPGTSADRPGHGRHAWLQCHQLDIKFYKQASVVP